jgi:DHA1 family tetracycline resistance protein-like MFS transporter
MLRLRQFDRRLLTILLIVFVQILGASLVLPILPLYAQRRFELSPQAITLLVSSFFAAQFLAGPTIGRLSDRYGRIPVLIISQIGTVISFIMLGVAQSFEMLFAARILDGITGGNIIVAQAYITDITPRERRTEALGYIFATFGLGFIFGPALGGLFAAAFPIQVPFFIAATLAAAVVTLTWYTLDETVSPQQREANRQRGRQPVGGGQLWRNYPLLTILGIAFVGQFALGTLQATFALYGEAILFAAYDERATNLGIGLLLSCVGLSQFLTQTLLLKRLLRRFNETTLVIAGTIIRGLSLFLFAVISSPWLGGVASALFALGVGITMPPLQALATSAVSDEERGGVLGIFQSAVSLSTIGSTAVAGFFFALDPTAPYWLGGAMSAAVAVPAFLLRGKFARNRAGAEQPTSSNPAGR